MSYSIGYDAATGEIKAMTMAESFEEVAKWADRGLTVLNVPDQVDLDAFLVRNGALVPKDLPTEAEILAASKVAAQGRLLSSINYFIEHKPDGSVRYDTNLKLNLLQAALNAALAQESTPAPVVAVQAWISAVQIEYFRLKAAVASASTSQALEAVDLSIATLESKFGTSGSVLADPDVSTAQLVGA